MTEKLIVALYSLFACFFLTHRWLAFGSICGGLHRIDSRQLYYQASWMEAFLFNGIGGLVEAAASNGGGSGRGGEQWQWRRWVAAMDAMGGGNGCNGWRQWMRWVTAMEIMKRCQGHKSYSLNSDSAEGAP